MKKGSDGNGAGWKTLKKYVKNQAKIKDWKINRRQAILYTTAVL